MFKIAYVHVNSFFVQALIHGLGRHYYSLPINYRKNELEQKVGKLNKRMCACVHVCDCVMVADVIELA